MKFIIAGASGFIGRNLCAHLVNEHQVVALTRKPEKKRALLPPEVTCKKWITNDPSPWLDDLKNADVLINLIGENLAAGLWTKKFKQKLRNSRIDAVKTIAQALEQTSNQSLTYIQASAVGYYGNVSEAVDETAPAGNDFLARLVADWENAAQPIVQSGIRTIFARFGLVLGSHGGALPKLVLPFRLFVGGPLGSGLQGFPYIHIYDVVQGLLFLINHTPNSGVFNFVAPQTINQKTFCKALAKTLRRPCWLPAPSFLLKLFLGEMAEVALLSGQVVIPRALQKAGYEFYFKDIQKTLDSLLK